MFLRNIPKRYQDVSRGYVGDFLLETDSYGGDQRTRTSPELLDGHCSKQLKQ